MNTETNVSQEYRDLLALKFLLVAITPGKVLSTQTVAAALGCCPATIQTLVDGGNIPSLVNDEAPAGGVALIPRSFVAKYLFLVAAETSNSFVDRVNAFLPLLDPAGLNTAKAAIADLMSALLNI
jgi:hypothetical protein